MAVAPEWAAVDAEQVAQMLERLIGDVESGSGTGPAYLAALVWAVGYGAAPVTGRPDQPVTVEVAEVEWWSAWAAVNPKTVHLAPLAEISEELGVAYRRPNEVGVAVADATHAVVGWLLGVDAQHRPDRVAAWMFQGPTPTAEQLFGQRPEARAGARRQPEHWAAVWQRMERHAARHRRMATWLRQIVQAARD
jgi:hypothetical protein